ncbi:hypothetical protein T12_4614 [Trichinella patagoniensis]|uniref:Uncharacterized protein n=1 Tax=Trichinella patagoniensis TaxID=990121 RepID=A0A0V1A2E0_9BILA|nr:hypothetical protein T12_4614 [Trichinella patagoniensis]
MRNQPEIFIPNYTLNMGGLWGWLYRLDSIVLSSDFWKGENCISLVIGSKAICSLDRWSSKAISRRQGNATDKKSTMPIPLLTTTDRSVVNNSGRLLIG